jgi:nicotinate-nucleotide pyrophosphorylase (carboxylating)
LPEDRPTCCNWCNGLNCSKAIHIRSQCSDIILLDNFSINQLREAVAIRNERKSPVELEASGNVRIDTLPAIAATGVDRISSGALTHQATSLDLGLDWFDSNLS